MSNEKVLQLSLEDIGKAHVKRSPSEQKIRDYKICCISREVSLLSRRDVLTGKAKFGITGDGKELPQVAMAQVFQKGDFRTGYYRDQTFMFALGVSTVQDSFAQLYADPENDPFSGGRQMNNHFATALIDDKGDWLRHTDQYNIAADISSTGGQMARALGLALASKHYRQQKANHAFSQNGNEVVFCTIGDASTSEGVFWETINAAAVQQVPLAVFIYDDGYGISVPSALQTAKGNISEILSGFQSDTPGEGIDLYTVPGHNYSELLATISQGIQKVRTEHKPAVFHIRELTQPQGHSTSGSHERYKDKKRLKWEKENDCIKRFEEHLLQKNILDEDDITVIRKEAKRYVRECRNEAMEALNRPIKERLQQLKEIYADLPEDRDIQQSFAALGKHDIPLLSEVTENARRLGYLLRKKEISFPPALREWIRDTQAKAKRDYEQHLYAEGPRSAIRIPAVAPIIRQESKLVNGYQILNRFFDQKLEEVPELLAFGEDLGHIGGVNQGFAGLQDKHGEERVFDTGIREWTIMGQTIGLAMRGLRPIGEIQYLDYLIYGLEPLTDDLATLRWRTDGLQAAPAIIRTRGHRLEGIWHSGSPMGMMVNSLRGMHICVPRDMVQAAGMYNTLLQSMDPGIVVECLNGYRLKERLPENIGDYTVPLGVPELLIEGRDITLVTYGSCVRVARKACEMLSEHGIAVELIDIQTLLPFDLEHRILASVRKTNRILFVDEDVPGGGTAYMMQKVLEEQNAYRYLDAKPETISAKAHRPPYGSDGDYFSKPSAEDIFETIYHIMEEAGLL